MKTNFVFAAGLVAFITLSAIAQVQPEDAAREAQVEDNLPPSPDKSLKRKIWEGYYEALLNRNYHLARSKQMVDASQSNASSGLLIGIVSFIVPLMLTNLQVSGAIRQKTERQKLSAVLGNTWVTVAVFALSGVGLWYGISSSLEGSQQQGAAMAHEELYDDWKTLASQWQDLHDLSLNGTTPDILRLQYERLLAIQKAISDRETSVLYDPDLHREVQAKLNDYLVEDAKHSRT